MAIFDAEHSNGNIPATDITLPSETTDVTLVGTNKYFVVNGICFFILSFSCADITTHEYGNILPRGYFGGASYIYFYPTTRMGTIDNDISSGEVRINTYGNIRFHASKSNIQYSFFGCYPVATNL